MCGFIGCTLCAICAICIVELLSAELFARFTRNVTHNHNSHLRSHSKRHTDCALSLTPIIKARESSGRSPTHILPIPLSQFPLVPCLFLSDCTHTYITHVIDNRLFIGDMCTKILAWRNAPCLRLCLRVFVCVYTRRVFVWSTRFFRSYKLQHAKTTRWSHRRSPHAHTNTRTHIE